MSARVRILRRSTGSALFPVLLATVVFIAMTAALKRVHAIEVLPSTGTGSLRFQTKPAPSAIFWA